MKPPANSLKHVIVTLFERNGKPYIRLLFVANDGEASNVETELDCKSFRINFMEDEPKQLPPKYNEKLN